MIKYIKELSKKISIKAGILAGILMLTITPLLITSHADAMTSNAQNLAGLIAVNNTIGNGSSSGAFTSGTSNLDELIVLSGLFPTSTNASTNAKNLAGLIAVNNVTGGSNGGSFTKSSNDLASLLVLNGLFLDP